MIPTLFQAFILAFYLASIDVLSGILSGFLSGIFSVIPSGTLSGIYSDILSGILFWQSSWHSIPLGPLHLELVVWCPAASEASDTEFGSGKEGRSEGVREWDRSEWGGASLITLINLRGPQLAYLIYKWVNHFLALTMIWLITWGLYLLISY